MCFRKKTLKLATLIKKITIINWTSKKKAVTIKLQNFISAPCDCRTLEVMWSGSCIHMKEVKRQICSESKEMM